MARERATLRLYPLKSMTLSELVARVFYNRKSLVDAAVKLLLLVKSSGCIEVKPESIRELCTVVGTSKSNLLYIVRRLQMCGLIDVEKRGRRVLVIKLSTRFCSVLMSYVDVWRRFLSN
ncbi:MAG: hypothetical protein DRJ40_03260 [Thermoprotei archaeon]|nr:MAG: hypothetical protein DRJ40_03260 [Thermoprotei archaeon]